MADRAIAAALHPAAVTVVGASPRRATSHNLLNSLLSHKDFQFPGPVYLVNRSRPSLLGLQAVAATSDVAAEPGLVVLLIPTEQAVDALDGFRYTPQGVICYGPGAESGHGEAESALAQWCLSRNVPLFGPQSIGVAYSPSRLMPLIAPLPEQITMGAIALVMQSGGLLGGTLRAFAQRGLGLHSAFSIGNAAAVGYDSVVEFLIEDEECGAIGLYLESVPSLLELRAIANRAAAAGKPLVLAVGGRSEAGRQGIASHTGSLATPTRLVEGVASQVRILLVSDTDELVWSLEALAKTEFRRAPSPRVGLVTSSGGGGIMAADSFAAAGIAMPPPSDETREILQTIASGDVGNPFDMGGLALDEPARLHQSITEFARDRVFGIVAFVSATGIPARVGMRALESQVDTFVSIVRGTGKMAFVATPAPGLPSETDVSTARWPGVAIGAGTHESVAMLRAIAWWAEEPTDIDRHFTKLAADPVRVQVGKGRIVTGRDAINALSEMSVEWPWDVTVTSLDEVSAACDQWPYPLVVKAEVGLAHRAVSGGVLVGITNAALLIPAVEYLLRKFGGAITIAQQVPHEREYILGYHRSHVHGPLILFGEGGIGVGESVEFRILPMSSAEANALVATTPDLESAARAPMVAAVLSLQRTAIATPWMLDVDLNPLVVHDGRIVALDAKIHTTD